MRKQLSVLAAVAALVAGLATLLTGAVSATPGWTPIPPGPFGPTNDWLVVREVHWTWPSVDLFYRSQWGLTTPMDFGPGALGQGTSRDGWHKADSNLPDAAQTSGELAALDIGGNVVPGQGGTLTAYLQVECPTQRAWALGLGFELVDLDPGTGVNEFIMIWPSTPGWTAEMAYAYGQACAPPTGFTPTPTASPSPTLVPPTATPSNTPTATATLTPTPTPGVLKLWIPCVLVGARNTCPTFGQVWVGFTEGGAITPPTRWYRPDGPLPTLPPQTQVWVKVPSAPAGLTGYFLAQATWRPGQGGTPLVFPEKYPQPGTVVRLTDPVPPGWVEVSIRWRGTTGECPVSVFEVKIDDDGPPLP